MIFIYPFFFPKNKSNCYKLTTMKRILFAGMICLTFVNTIMAQQPPKATVVLAAKTKHLKIYTLVSPGVMFANTSHVIELSHQLIVVDGQFFALYGTQLKALTDSLKKPVTRFYISHDHPDHYLGFGDAFPDVPVYALAETAEAIKTNGDQTLKARQEQFGGLIAKTVHMPDHIQVAGTEVIDGVTFVFEQSNTSLFFRAL